MVERSTQESNDPRQKLQQIIDSPNQYNFGNDFIHYCSPVGFNHIKECNNTEVLKQYKHLCKERLPGDYFSDNPMARRRAEDKQHILKKIDERIQQVKFPHPTNWPVNKEFVDFVSTLSLPTKRSRKFNQQSWERVWDSCTTDDLIFIQEALKYAPIYGQAGRSRHERVLDAFLYYHNQRSIQELFNISNRGNGPSDSIVSTNLEVVFDKVDPVIGGMLCHWVWEITTNISENGAGKYSNSERRINISQCESISSDHRKHNWRNTTIHEVGHALHHFYGIWVNGDIDNREKPRNKWKENVVQRNHNELTTTQKAFLITIQLEWEKLREDEIEPLHNYQTKNVDEFIAVGFEAWMLNPEKLNRAHPQLKQLFDAHFGKQNYKMKATRLNSMPSPVKDNKQVVQST